MLDRIKKTIIILVKLSARGLFATMSCTKENKYGLVLITTVVDR